MEKVLVVEDSKLVCRMLKRTLETKLALTVTAVHSYAEAKTAIEADRNGHFMALVDLTLPDARNYEIVDLTLGFDIPTVVFTSTLAEDVRELILKKGVVDYVFKQNHTDLNYVVRLVNRIRLNQNIEVLIVDDSKAARMYLRKLLTLQQLKVFEAFRGQDALDTLKANPNIKLVLVDYEMPKMNGCELISKIRHFRNRDDLAIIGISGHGAGHLSARLLKAGADDFLRKPFVNEEFLCRVMQNLENLERIIEVRDASMRDYLTGLYNRRFFFQAGSRLFDTARRKQADLVTAVIDADHFKRINDTYGHHVGDLALKHLANYLKENLRDGDIVARFGGEEFVIVATDVAPGHVHKTFERLRRSLVSKPCSTDNLTIPLTVSIGIAVNLGDSFEDMIARADKQLYLAKQRGRNRIMIESHESLEDHKAEALAEKA